jgi:hypothetical protein
MGRGLSALQCFILRRTGEQHRLYFAEVLVEYFGWPVVGPWAALRRDDRGDLAHPGAHRFDAATIGRTRYHNTRSVLAQACRRLEARGLVTRWYGTTSHWQAVAITDAGRAWLAADGAPPVAEQCPGVERTCTTCGHAFVARRSARTCSSSCRQRAYRVRHPTQRAVRASRTAAK